MPHLQTKLQRIYSSATILLKNQLIRERIFKEKQCLILQTKQQRIIVQLQDPSSRITRNSVTKENCADMLQTKIAYYFSYNIIHDLLIRKQTLNKGTVYLLKLQMSSENYHTIYWFRPCWFVEVIFEQGSGNRTVGLQSLNLMQGFRKGCLDGRS